MMERILSVLSHGVTAGALGTVVLVSFGDWLKLSVMGFPWLWLGMVGALALAAGLAVLRWARG